MASGTTTRAASMRVVGVSRHHSGDDAQYSDAGSDPEKENAKLVSIRDLVAKNAAKDRPKLVVMGSGDSRKNILSEILNKKMGGALVSGSITASPSSSASSSSSTTPKTGSQQQLQVPSGGGSTALNALNELLQKRQPAQPQPPADVSKISPKQTHRKRRTENPALQALLAQRNGTAEPVKSCGPGESRNRAIAELLAKRVTPHPAPEGGENTDREVRKTALTELLAKRGASKEPQPQNHAVADKSTKRQSATNDADMKANALAAMLAKRNGGASGGSPAVRVPELKKSNAGADMFAERAQTQQPAANGGDSRSAALAEMLTRRGGGNNSESTTPTPTGKASSNPISDMLAKRQAPSRSDVQPSPANPIAAMLAKRQGGGTAAAAQQPANPLAEMMAKRQAAPASSNPIAEMMAKRQAAAASSPASSSPTAEPQATETPAGDEHANTPLREHPKYGSYFKMLKFGLTPDVVKHRMRKEDVDPAILDCDPAKPLPKEPVGGDVMDTQDPEYLEALKTYNAKLPIYQQMLKMGLPRQAVEHKMQREGIDRAWLDGPPQPKKKVVPTGPTEAEIATHREKYKKYFQMLKLGLPRDAVEHKMRSEGVDPQELDGPIVAGAGPSAASASKKHGLPPAPLVKKANSIRKKIHWEVKRQESRDSSRESLWNVSIHEESVAAGPSKETKEGLEKLFVKELAKGGSTTAASTENKKGSKPTKKQVMYLIDMKKSQNISITLARIKLPFPELKSEILALNPTVLSTAQLQSLMDMWPDQQEQVAIDNFHGDDSLLGAAEKFLVEVRNIPRFREKLGCLVFKQEFSTRVHELRESINLVIRGVNQVCCSSALQRLFIYILQTGNMLNFGTDDNQPGNVAGFALNSLVKLSQTKAFTGGVTFLQYIVQSIERDIPQLARFPQQVNLIQKCSKVSISSLFSEKRALEDGLKSLNHEAQAVMPSEPDADAELGSSILKQFATEVEREIDALETLLDQLVDCKRRFLEYFEEEETSEELDVLLSHIASFTGEFEREHSKHLDVLEKKRLQEQQQREQEAKKQQSEKRKQMGKAPRHSLHENPLHHRRSNQHAHDRDHGRKHAPNVQLRHTMGARPVELEPTQNGDAEDKKKSVTPAGQRDYFPQFVVDRLKKPSLSRQSSELGAHTTSLDPSATTAA